MKRHFYFLLIMLAIGVVSCDFASKKNTDNNTTTVDSPEVVADSSEVAVPEQEPVDLSECDMVMLDKGKLYFYNSEQQALTPYEAETDSVVNSIFVGNKLYYCVPENGKIVLKSIQLDVLGAQPVKEADWGLDYEKCVTETYGTVSPLTYYEGHNMLSLWHEFSWDSYSLTQQKLFNLNTGEVTDWGYQTWQEEPNQGDDDERFLERFLKTEDGQLWFVEVDATCLTDQIDFERYVSDPDYASEPEFEFVSSSPDNTKILYMAMLEWGDYPHGPLCISDVYGTYQVALEDTDCSEFKAQWLADGSLVYVGYEQLEPGEYSKWQNSTPCIKRIYPDGSWESFFRGNDFQIRKR